MPDYKELFDYFKRQRARLTEALEKLPLKELTKDRGLSFGSIKNVLAHTVMNEDIWLHQRLAGIKGEKLDWQARRARLEKFQNLEDVKRYMAEVDHKTARLFKGMTDQDLRKLVKDSKPGEVYRLEDILYQIPVETIYHFGEIFAELWKMNLEPPYYSYLAYSKDKTRENPP